MTLKSEIKKVITANSKYRAVKVWSIKIESGDMLGSNSYMMIEVEVKKKRRKQ